jgi:hypothetical protein
MNKAGKIIKKGTRQRSEFYRVMTKYAFSKSEQDHIWFPVA